MSDYNYCDKLESLWNFFFQIQENVFWVSIFLGLAIFTRERWKQFSLSDCCKPVVRSSEKAAIARYVHLLLSSLYFFIWTWRYEIWKVCSVLNSFYIGLLPLKTLFSFTSKRRYVCNKTKNVLNTYSKVVSFSQLRIDTCFTILVPIQRFYEQLLTPRERYENVFIWL